MPRPNDDRTGIHVRRLAAPPGRGRRSATATPRHRRHGDPTRSGRGAGPDVALSGARRLGLRALAGRDRRSQTAPQMLTAPSRASYSRGRRGRPPAAGLHATMRQSVCASALPRNNERSRRRLCTDPAPSMSKDRHPMRRAGYRTPAQAARQLRNAHPTRATAVADLHVSQTVVWDIPGPTQRWWAQGRWLVTTRVPRAVRSRRSQISTVSGISP